MTQIPPQPFSLAAFFSKSTLTPPTQEELVGPDGHLNTRQLWALLNASTPECQEPRGWVPTSAGLWYGDGLVVLSQHRKLTVISAPVQLTPTHHELIRELIACHHVAITLLQPEHVPLLGEHFSVVKPGHRKVYSRAFLSSLGFDFPGIPVNSNWGPSFYPAGLGELIDVEHHVQPDQEFSEMLRYHSGGLLQLPSPASTWLPRSYWIHWDHKKEASHSVQSKDIEELFTLWQQLCVEDRERYVTAARTVNLAGVTVPWVRTVLERILAS